MSGDEQLEVCGGLSVQYTGESGGDILLTDPGTPTQITGMSANFIFNNGDKMNCDLIAMPQVRNQ